MKMSGMTRWMALGLGVALVPVAGCEDNPAGQEEDATVLLSVLPEGGATGVDPTGPIMIEFNHSMMAGMEAYIDLHEGDVNGPVVPCTFSWSGDRSRITLTPSSSLEGQTTYVIHVGGGMSDAEGHHVELEEHGTHMGGEWFTQGMTQGGHHGGGMGGGMGGGSGMGPGWTHPTNGSYGMIFSFTTA